MAQKKRFLLHLAKTTISLHESA